VQTVLARNCSFADGETTCTLKYDNTNKITYTGYWTRGGLDLYFSNQADAKLSFDFTGEPILFTLELVRVLMSLSD
jgi:hypothetical protein